MLVLLIALYGNHKLFLISKRSFHCTVFVYATSHIKPSKHNSNYGTKISITFEKNWGMMLWIRTSTFNNLMQQFKDPLCNSNAQFLKDILQVHVPNLFLNL